MQKKSSLKPFYLSLSKWRCGDNGVNMLGTGYTELENKDGFMCCLGQGLKQFDRSTNIFQLDEPKDTSTRRRLFVTYIREDMEDESFGTWDNSDFSVDAMYVNDELDLTTPERIVALEFLLQGEGYRLVVVD